MKYDVVIIGAGIQGAGVAQAAAAAGYRVLLLEKDEVASGTSRRSSKLIHGGLRYLESGQFSLVRKALKERAILCKIAPGLVKLVPFYIPVYSHTTRRPWQLWLGLVLYSILGSLKSKNFFKKLNVKGMKLLPALQQQGLQTVFKYYDGQTDDRLLTQAVIDSATQLGVELLCHSRFTSADKTESGYRVNYIKDDAACVVETRMIIIAAGPWVNHVHQNIENAHSLDVDLVQGTHILLDVKAPEGVFYVEAEDKRAVFVMPWQGKTLVGTTETLFEGDAEEVKPGASEVKYLLDTYQSYFPIPQHPKQNVKVIEQFAGLRVLPRNDGGLFSRPRDTILHWAAPNVLSLYGGKLTAYRSTAELVIKKIKTKLPQRQRIATTESLPLSGRLT